VLLCLALSSSEKAQSLVAITYKGPANLTLHEPIIVQFSIENGSPESVRLDLGLDRKENFIVEIGQPDGVRVQARQLPMHAGLNRRGKVSVAPGDRYQQKLVLNNLSSFDQTGTYQVTIRLRTPVLDENGRAVATPTTGAFTLLIAPRNEERLQRTCERLAQITVSAFEAEESLNSADALSQVKDPVGVWWMQWVLWRTDKVDSILTRGLSRIGDAAARAVLAEVAAFGDSERSEAARIALMRLGSNAR
jgi:uncharacterized glyoxalase superfamily protein PhnB